MKYFLITLLSVTLGFNLQSQEYISIDKTLNLYDIESEKLELVIDTVIGYEKNESYYNDSLVFLVSVRLLESPDIKKAVEGDLFEICINTTETLSDLDKVTGYFYYHNHLFLICSNNDKFRLLKKTNKTMKFQYKYKVNSNNNDKHRTTNLTPIDDTHTSWCYLYYQKTDVFKGMSNL